MGTPLEYTLAIAQINPHVGALTENRDKMLKVAERAQQMGASLLLFSELALTGYPPEDLLHKPQFLQKLAKTEQQLQYELANIGIDVVYGSVRQQIKGLFNAGVYVSAGQEVGFASKWRLPNYGVFDEQRYFIPAEESELFFHKTLPFGITICEDIWHAGGPLQSLAQQNAALILNLNASPYHVGRHQERLAVVQQRVAEHGMPIIYVNQVGGQDELVFDGGSFAISRNGETALCCLACHEDLRLLNIRHQPGEKAQLLPARVEPQQDEEQELYAALCLGLKDYVSKNGFSGVVLGLSGGIDSALTAVICADALGVDKVEALMMPSQYTAAESLEDAAEEARILGMELTEIAIGPIFDLFRQQLAEPFAGLAEDVTEENIQPRIRATLLMAVANKKRKLLITTGNKSEVSVGYATLYGDMAGGYSVLKDLLKGRVYALSRARNRWAVARGELPPIPQRVLEKAPTAELRPNQKDSDSLPDYPLLDRILAMYVEQERSLQEIVAVGIDPATAKRVIELVDRNEYKRRQAPPGVRITRRAFGKDRRYPLTNGFRIE